MKTLTFLFFSCLISPLPGCSRKQQACSYRGINQQWTQLCRSGTWWFIFFQICQLSDLPHPTVVAQSLSNPPWRTHDLSLEPASPTLAPMGNLPSQAVRVFSLCSSQSNIWGENTQYQSFYALHLCKTHDSCCFLKSWLSL